MAIDFSDTTKFVKVTNATSSYYLSNTPQGGDEWKSLRGGLLTASKFRRCRSLDPWSNIEGLIYDIQNKTDSTEKNYIMELGNFYEPYARQWYAKTYNYVVKEVGLAIPTWDTRIGASSDGIVYDPNNLNTPIGMIEIKSPEKIYDGIETNYRRCSQNKPLQYNPSIQAGYSYIKPDHFDQIQGNLSILGLNFCDYVVFSWGEKRCYVERIPYIQDYWQNTLYPDLCGFLDLVAND